MKKPTVKISKFNYSPSWGCLMAKAHMDDVVFGVLVNEETNEVSLFVPLGGDIAEVESKVGPYADAICDCVALKFGMEVAEL